MVAPLVAWYQREARDLPWRKPAPGMRDRGRPDAYRVLVSEAMLQQTQVATVVPYYHRFLEAFPTVADLAAADEQAVLRLWQGLGYYRRARHLHAAAEAVVAAHGGRVPTSAETLRQLPGVGRYTAAAVASIAGGEPVAVVDGNVMRVLARWLLIEDPVDATGTTKRLWAAAEAMVDGAATRDVDPGDLNQAVMELGALVCTSKAPRCLTCPVRERCRAAAEGDPARLPVKKPKRPPKPVTHTVVAVERGGRYLFEQRPAEGLWSNMWQLPTHESLDSTSPVAWVADALGLRITTPREVGTFTHQTTHRTIRFVVHHARVTAGRLRPRRGVWRRLDAADDLPLPNPQRRVVGLLKEQGVGSRE